MASYGWIHRQRKDRANRSLFASLLGTPATGSVKLPANGKLGFRPSADLAAGEPLASIAGPTSRTIESAGLEAGEVQILDWVERGSVVTPPAGVDVMLNIGFGKYQKICEGA